jgi:superfamily I DNA/RNA helicase
MTLDLFEGAAGTGKTHNLVVRAAERIQNGVLGEDRRVLALTYMNGARRRLHARLGQQAIFRRRFECQTFDVFARTLATRRRSLFSGNATALAHAATLGEFDGPCFLAATLLQVPAVQRWVAASYPLILVDEAQDLDEYRMGVLQGLSKSCSIVAAADTFQCLVEGRDPAGVVGWLENNGLVHRLTQPRRTMQRGLLETALAAREGRDLRSVLIKREFKGRSTWIGQGVRLFEVPAKQGLIAWNIANEMSQRPGQTVILTPDAKSKLLRTALDTVAAKAWPRKNGATFGPYPITWEKQDSETADTLLADLPLPDTANYTQFCTALAPGAAHAPIAHAIARMDRMRRLSGQSDLTAAQVTAFVHEAVRNQSRLGLAESRGHLAMTIQGAKNREFPNVIVLWPHTATGSEEHQRRLLYNGITRAVGHCSVIVLGAERVNGPPFAPRTASAAGAPG